MKVNIIPYIIMAVGGFIMVAILMVAIGRQQEQNRTNQLAEQQAQIEACQRAFDYTRDQCEFIVRNHVMVGK